MRVGPVKRPGSRRTICDKPDYSHAPDTPGDVSNLSLRLALLWQAWRLIGETGFPNGGSLQLPFLPVGIFALRIEHPLDITVHWDDLAGIGSRRGSVSLRACGMVYCQRRRDL